MKKIKRIHARALSLMLVLCMLVTTFSIGVFAEGNDSNEPVAVNLNEVVSSDGTTEESTAEDENMVDVVMLVKDVAASRKIKKTDVEVKKYKDVNLPKNIISDPSKVIGKYAKRALYAGEYVYADQLSDKSTTQSSSHILKQTINKSKESFVDVTDYFDPNTGEDVTTHIQKLIDTNNQRTIYFPDGEYIISRPILTNGGASYTVSLWLSDGAVIKADPENWRADGNNTAMFCLGKQDRDEGRNNDVVSTGSYYSLQGGTIDGSGKARAAVSLGGGRETLVKNIVLKNVTVGIEIPVGTNNVSSDMDVDDVTIIGTGKGGSVGINILGYDNTFSNVRIYNMEMGITVESGGNAFRDIRVYNTSDSLYTSTRGIREVSGSNNFYYHCYVQDCAYAFELNGASNINDSLTAKWTKNQGAQQMFVLKSSTSQISMCRAEYFGNGKHTLGATNVDFKIEQTYN